MRNSHTAKYLTEECLQAAHDLLSDLRAKPKLPCEDAKLRGFITAALNNLTWACDRVGYLQEAPDECCADPFEALNEDGEADRG